LLPEQIGDLETLVRSLGQRERLRPLLDQVLDALVLWTGVERGLLLLRAPGGRLVPRAGRNLGRSDLTGPSASSVIRWPSEPSSSRSPWWRWTPWVSFPRCTKACTRSNSAVSWRCHSWRGANRWEWWYLDDRVRRGAFGARELGWVKLVATLASVAIADARDQILLRRAARRTERAERRLGRARTA